MARRCGLFPTILSVPNLTPDSCRSGCQGAGHAYAGVQYGYLCRCGNSYGKYTKVSDEECNALCVGDRAQKCGGFWRSAVFTTGKWDLQDKQLFCGTRSSQEKKHNKG